MHSNSKEMRHPGKDSHKVSDGNAMAQKTSNHTESCAEQETKEPIKYGEIALHKDERSAHLLSIG
ncbi:MAG: hypothetical protein B7Z37_10500 [Verrucomicrobia bacterium 12-59-8]|nr:MAG: hypothetical protein B7Z37_10500 [Verrucomicrobia bacterium 12-59-8]